MTNLFTTHDFYFNGSEIELFPFGDVHHDTKGCDHERFKAYIDKSKKYDQKKCLYLTMGDLLDFASSSEKKKLWQNGLHETTIDRFDRMAKQDIKSFCKIVEHIKGRTIGVIGGNHSWKFADGKYSDEVIAEELKSTYLGWLSYIRVHVTMTNSTARSSFDIVACHGKAGGKLIGTSINQVDDLRKIFPEADLFIMGHDHKLSSTPAVSLYAYTDHANRKTVIKQREQRLLRSGSFKKTYTPNEESYEINRLYQPSILGGLHLTIKFIRSKKNGNDTIIKSIESHV